jgi:putative transposase
MTNHEAFNLPTPPGFQSLNPDLPVSVYERHLPHWRQDGTTYFVTFRQADSLPQSRIGELKQLREEWERLHPPPRSRAVLEKLAKQIFVRLERWLDEGYGSCELRNAEVANEVVSAMQHFDGDRYLLGSCVVMPNHVHVIVRPLNPRTYDLEDILQSWKGYTARRINSLLHRTGTFWQEECYDRIIRDEEHLYRCIQYIARNPIKAGIRLTVQPWVRQDWRDAGWDLDELHREQSPRVKGRTDLEVRPTEGGETVL